MHTDFGYIDLQVNGYADVDFNADELSVERVAALCERLKSEGVEHILPTVITADLESMRRRLANIVRVKESDEDVDRMLCGIHIEGPFLNPEAGYIGAHPREHARRAVTEIMLYLLHAAEGWVKIVTLAPECDPGQHVTKTLVGMGIQVAAGHCNPTLYELQASIDAGLSLFTHLGNGCPAHLPRHDNIIQRVLSFAKHLHIGFIADGVHVPFFALKNYLDCCGIDRAFVVTDAICGAGQGPGEYTIGDQRVVIDENLATWSADGSHLMGSASTMQRSELNLRNALGLSDAEIRTLLRDNPLKILGAE
ncbi:MAG TPA: N-acetylglucosamine-6-phosphate deacetylase [Lacipirellulaceae bacterium]|jgi:N-acetylglucosamine-6-phosphate deacetylase|nr:N-acetylglucosamine-6-phosphate deacetylase [Lacipirellulaceae bacterium]